MTIEPTIVYVTGRGGRTHIADGEKVIPSAKAWYRQPYWNTLCGVTAEHERLSPTVGRPLCRHCERVAAKAAP